MRLRRKLKIGAKYHVSAKINRGEFIFADENFKILFLDTIKRAKKKYKFRIENFVIMDNHIHLLIQPLDNENLSKIMQWILSVFAIYFNKINKFSGHVWKGRFFSRIIEDIRQYIDTFNYISDNPIKSFLVRDTINYKYCGIYHLINKIKGIIEEQEFIYLL
jgi:putative transposase